jgi:serine/threonine protein kinase
MHSKEVVHRDIKPANCLMKGDKFQIADVDDALVLPTTGEGELEGDVGPPFYRVPEFEINTSNVKAVDVYAVGVSLYEIFTRLPVEQMLKDITSFPEGDNIPSFEASVKDVIESGRGDSDSQTFQIVSQELLSVGSMNTHS